MNRYEVAIKYNNNFTTGSAVVHLDSSDSDDVIQRITIKDNTNHSGEIVILTIRKQGEVVDRSTLAGIEEIEILNPTGTLLDLRHIYIDGDLGVSSSLKFIRASKLSDISIGGNWYANVVANNQVSSTQSDIISALIDGSMIGGGLYNNEGSIDEMVINGSAIKNGSIIPSIWASTEIGDLSINGDAEAIIGSNQIGLSGNPDVLLLAIEGDFIDTQATMTMNSLGALTVGGDFESVVNVSSAMPSGSTYRIDGDLVSGAELNLPASGLVGQIIVNGADAAGSWVGGIKVGTTTLANLYSNTASSLGGGAAGLVPFNPHRTDSSPVLGANITFTTSTVTPSYDIRHYGPVTFDDQATPLMPIRIEKRARCVENATWGDVTGEWDFDYAVNSSNDTIVDMDATTAAHYRNGFEYRFVAETDTGEDDVLLCDLGLTSDPAVAVYPTDAWFTVGSECPWDIDNSGTTDVDDLNVVLSDWGIPDETNLAGDVNGNGPVDVDDLNLILSHWQETSCSGCSMSMMGGGGSSSFMMSGATPGDLLVSELGYATVEDFCAALEEMDGESQDALLIALGLVAAGE